MSLPVSSRSCVSRACPFSPRAAARRPRLSGTVVDSAGGVIPGATVVGQEQRDGRDVQHGHERRRRVLGAGARSRAPTRSRCRSSGFKTVGRSRISVLVAGQPGERQGHARSRHLHRDRRGQGGSELDSDAVGTVSSTLMTEQLKTMPLPTRNALYAVNTAARRRHDGHRARLDDQRPARSRRSTSRSTAST